MADNIGNIIRNNEHLISTLLDLMEGRNANAKINLDGITFKIGDRDIVLKGFVEFAVARPKKKAGRH